MKLLFRFIMLLATGFRRERCAPMGPCKSFFRVYPNDLDLNGHVNNGVYLTYADLGRFDLLLRAGFFGKILRNRWYPVVVAETIRFYRSLKLFQRFTIETRVIGWNERNVFMEQRFERGGQLVALAIINARFLSRKGGSVPTADFLEFIGIDAEPPMLPAWVSDWNDGVVAADNLYRDETEKG